MARNLLYRDGRDKPGHDEARGLPSPDRRRVLQAALGPQRVGAARDLQRRALADVAVEYLRVVSDVLDRAVGPVLGQAELLAVIPLGAEEALHVGIGGLHLLVDVLLGDAELFGR